LNYRIAAQGKHILPSNYIVHLKLGDKTG